MKKSRVLISAAALAGICTIGASLTGFAAPDAEQVNAVDAVAAIQGVVPELLSGLAAASSDGDPAAAATVEGSRVEIPVNPTDGLSLGDSVSIGLPFARQASDATDSQLPGVVAYDNKNGSTTVPLIKADGGVQINTVIENSSAPNRYDYPIDVPADASLTQDANGTFAVVGADGSPLRVFGEAWAKDANGEAVPTHYEVRGNTLTQVFDFTEHTAFPVVADPTTTGVYSYNCVLTNGQSVFLKPGEKLTNCKGSFLQKYISGVKVQTVSLVYNGKYTTKLSAARGLCLLASVGAALLIWDPPASAAAWVAAGITGAGAIGACTSL